MVAVVFEISIDLCYTHLLQGSYECRLVRRYAIGQGAVNIEYDQVLLHCHRKVRRYALQDENDR